MNDIKLYVNNEFFRQCPSLYEAVEWAIAYALEGYDVEVVCNGKTIADWGEGYLKAVYDKEVNEMNASNIVELKTWRFSSGRTEEEKVQVNLDEYAFFECDFLFGSWHLRGYKYDRKTHEWTREKVSLHYVSPLALAWFIYKVKKYAIENTGWRQASNVFRFNSCPYSNGFDEAMERLFKLVKEFEEKDKEDKQ